MQGVAGEVQAQRHLVLVQIGLNAHVRRRPVDGRPLPAPGPITVDDGILDPQGTELAMADAARGAIELDGETAPGGKVLFPGDGRSPGIEAVAIHGGEAGQGQEYPVGHPGPEAGAVGVPEGAGEAGAAAGLLDPRQAKG